MDIDNNIMPIMWFHERLTALTFDLTKFSTVWVYLFEVDIHIQIMVKKKKNGGLKNTEAVKGGWVVKINIALSNVLIFF